MQNRTLVFREEPGAEAVTQLVATFGGQLQRPGIWVVPWAKETRFLLWRRTRPGGLIQLTLKGGKLTLNASAGGWARAQQLADALCAQLGGQVENG